MIFKYYHVINVMPKFNIKIGISKVLLIAIKNVAKMLP